jgi:hypothetical protein
MTNTGLRIKRTRLTVPPRERSTERARIQARAFPGAGPKQTAPQCKSSTQSSKSGAERALTIAFRLTRRLEYCALLVAPIEIRIHHHVTPKDEKS